MSDMALRQKLAQAMVHATNIERARCLWLLDDMLEKLRADLKKKVLIESERYLVETKMRLASSIINQLRIEIIMNRQMPERKSNGEEADTD